MKRLLFAINLLILTFEGLSAQLTLDQCLEKSRQNYPQIKQFELIEKSAEYSLSNASKVYLPQVNVSAKATYQSDAIKLSLPIPGVDTISVNQSRDQYQMVAEVTQTLWDGGVTSARKKMIKASAEADKQKLEVEMYTIRDRVNQLYFGLLLLTEQGKQLDILQEELQTNLDKTKACMRNGVAKQPDVDALSVELLTNEQRRIEREASEKSYRMMLSTMMGEEIKESTVLVKPSDVMPNEIISVKRPEMSLFDAQLHLLDNQSLMEQTALTPKLGMFFQGGYGRPGLNMLSDDFSPFYIGGIRFSWNLSSFYNNKNNQASIRLNKDLVNTNRETFLFNNNLKIKQQNTEIEKIRELLRSDDEIIRLRNNMKQACSAKVDNGVSTVTDLLREINAESTAKQQKALHEIQLLLQIHNLKNSTNN